MLFNIKHYEFHVNNLTFFLGGMGGGGHFFGRPYWSTGMKFTLDTALRMLFAQFMLIEEPWNGYVSPFCWPNWN